jgi:hypothetical protein
VAATLLNNPKLGLLLAVLFTASMWLYVERVMIPHQISAAVAYDSPRGSLSDLYPRWLGARELLLHHRDPYSPEVTRQIEIGYYGRALDPTRPGDPKDPQAFAYPVYVVFLIAPTIGFPFSVVQEVFRWFLLLLTAATVPCCHRDLDRRYPGIFPGRTGTQIAAIDPRREWVDCGMCCVAGGWSSAAGRYFAGSGDH